MNGLGGCRCIRFEYGAVEVQLSVAGKNGTALALAETEAEDVAHVRETEQARASEASVRAGGTRKPTAACVCARCARRTLAALLPLIVEPPVTVIEAYRCREENA